MERRHSPPAYTTTWCTTHPVNTTFFVFSCTCTQITKPQSVGQASRLNHGLIGNLFIEGQRRKNWSQTTFTKGGGAEKSHWCNIIRRPQSVALCEQQKYCGHMIISYRSRCSVGSGYRGLMRQEDSECFRIIQRFTVSDNNLVYRKEL